MLTHRNVIDNAVTFARVHYGADDRLLIAAPLFHCWGLINGVLGIFAVRGTAIAVRRFRTEPVLDLIERARPTLFLGVPTMINYMAKSPGDRQPRPVEPPRRPLCRGADAPGADRCAPARLGGWLRRVVRPDRNQPGHHHDDPRRDAPRLLRPGHGRHRAEGGGRRGQRTLPVGAVGELWAQGTAISAGYFRPARGDRRRLHRRRLVQDRRPRHRWTKRDTSPSSTAPRT